jgi:hypothetical protein
MSLPTAAIDRLFDRLNTTYGSEFQNKWSGLKLADVKTNWSYELGMFSNNLNAIGWALENLPDRCPNLIEFKSLCKQAPRPKTLELDAPKAQPEVVDKELAKMALQAFTQPKDDQGNVDHKRWAKKLEQQQDKGVLLSTAQVQMYRKALYG